MTTPATRSLVIEKEFPYPPEKIWRALTEGSLIKEWLMDNDFQPVVGHRFSFRAPPLPNWNGIVDSQVLIVEPGKKLSARLYAWSNPVSRPTKRPRTTAPTMAGKSLSLVWNEWSPGCNNASIETKD
jgi:uncharacterized protein YndB with AHSA1/START domain